MANDEMENRGEEENSWEEDYESLTNMGHHVPCSVSFPPYPQSRAFLLLTGSLTAASCWVSQCLVSLPVGVASECFNLIHIC